MIIRHNKFMPTRNGAGFSMIDVLVAIIVLATALLALAALQGAMTRNTADARTRSQIAAFSEGLIEQARSAKYDCVGSADPACATPTTSGTVTITPNASGTAAQKAAAAMEAAAGVTITSITEKVDTYYGVAGSFTTTAPNPVDSTTPQYKQLTIDTAWTDATGQARTLSIDTIVSPVEVDTSNTLVSTPLVPDLSSSQTPIVREINPQAPGVIPIAVGNGSDTAATNPKPEILGSKNNQQLVGTTYNVLTYQAPDASNEVLIQKRVETQVLQCTCKYGAGSTDVTNDVFAQAFRPTYWDGTRYVVPDALPAPGYNTNNPGADPGTNKNPIIQSDYCLDCCRDHHDQSSSDPKYVRFDPFNTDPTTQNKTYNYVSGALVEAMGSSDQFIEACRLIRVDGLYHTATDLMDYHFGLLATKTSATNPAPDDTFVAKYQTFVKDYLTQAYVSPGTGPLSTSAANALYATDGLDLPAQIDITYVAATPDKRYMHARGLYIDHLEAVAQKAISDALGTCTSSDQSDCVLPLLPFTTINVTELANWCVTPPGASCPTNQIIQVSNNAIIGGDPTDPQRGVVTAEATAHTGDKSSAVATLAISNSGVAVGQPVDPNDALNPLTDSQAFNVSSGAATVSVPFQLYLSGLPNLTDSSKTDDPSASWKIGAVSPVPCALVRSGTSVDHYTCTTTSTSPTSTDVVIQSYNTTIPASNQTDPCNSKKKATLYTCQNYQVDTSKVLLNNGNVTPSVSVTGDGTLSEQSTITFPTLDGSVANTISIGFATQGGATNAPYTCTGTNSDTLTWTYPSFCAP